MASGSISNAPAPALSRDSTKKKRTNGSAKLKQIKLDVRREQWLSRVKKGCTVDSNGRVEHPPPSRHIANEQNVSSKKANRRERGEDVHGSSIQDNVMGSLANSPVLINFHLDDSGNGLFDSGSKSSSSMCNCVSENASNEEEDDGCFDDWEAVADALNADNKMQNLVSESATGPEMSNSFAGSTTSVPINAPNTGVDLSKKECRSAVPESHLNCRAWKPDDAFRPQCLPNLSRQHSSLMNSDWHGEWQSIISQPSCPICYEDLDVTDSSFLPCSCGFRLCLFCHKRILEADGRCPGCRKPYDHIDATVGFNMGAAALHITRSCSMSTGC
ncbi:hypothetical protein L6164_005893 [Bauhinia variegata]|uniref:Uncharacterized protein n=1 Tax=Bauhinia variegata TaxID=167791 RepID=A0ACB9PRX7_BAUVA|nr:hypothetical protein L6164_005893 [Bauhinia variegata]